MQPLRLIKYDMIMFASRYFIEKNGRLIWSYRRLEVALRRFDIVCDRSFKGSDIVRLISEDGEVIKEL